MKKLFYSLTFVLIVHCTFNIDNCSAQWVQTGGYYGGYVSSLTSAGDNIIAGTSGNGIFLSTNNGTNWTHVVIDSQAVNCLLTSGSTILAGASPDIYRSTNNGLNWLPLGFTIQMVNCLAVSGNKIFAGTNGNGIFLSTNNGTNWTQTSLNDKYVYSFAVNGNNIFAGTYFAGVYLSTNNGNNWTNMGLSQFFVNALAVNGTIVFAGTDSGIFRSTNNGSNWILNAVKKGRCFAVSGNYIFTSSDVQGVFLSSDNGNNWIPKNQGFPDTIPEVMSLYIASGYIFAGVNLSTTTAYVWRRSYSDIIGIKNISSIIPDKFLLYQNYPNPFNPSTNIRYQITNNKLVTLKIFDIIGREIETLVNEKQSPGTYEVTFDASQYPSSVYFYRFQSGNFSETKRMLMIK